MIYLDNNATTFIDPKIATRYYQLICESLGNPHSIHRYGQKARHLLVQAKKRIADWFEVFPNQVLITSGATEALNLAIQSASGHVITSSLEHAAVREAIYHAKLDATFIDPIAGSGTVSVEQISAAIRPNTTMIIISASNNETGICSDIQAIARLADQHGIALVIDAVAYVGKEVWQIPYGRVAVAISGHKIHAPVGVGALIISRHFLLKPLIVGGGQQKGLRGGTEMVALTDALAMALEQIDSGAMDHMRRLRDHFEKQLLALNPIIHGQSEKRVSNVSNLAFHQADGETLLMKLDLAGIAVSHGSACQSGSLQPSHVLTNMEVEPIIIKNSLRFSLSRYTTDHEIDQVIDVLTRTVLMPVSPVSSAARSKAPIEI